MMLLERLTGLKPATQGAGTGRPNQNIFPFSAGWRPCGPAMAWGGSVHLVKSLAFFVVKNRVP